MCNQTAKLNLDVIHMRKLKAETTEITGEMLQANLYRIDRI